MGIKTNRRPNPGELALLRVRVEKRCASRAQCVLDYIDLAQWRQTPRFPRAKVPPKLQGRVTPRDLDYKRLRGDERRTAKRQAFWHPDEGEAQLQEINRLMREHMRENPGDGMIAGPLAVAAKYAVEEWAASVWDLPGAEHAAALRTYLLDLFGIQLHQFDRDKYLAWREQSRANVSARDAGSRAPLG